MKIFLTAMATGMLFYVIQSIKAGYHQSKFKVWLKEKKNRKKFTVILAILVFCIFILLVYLAVQ